MSSFQFLLKRLFAPSQNARVFLKPTFAQTTLKAKKKKRGRTAKWGNMFSRSTQQMMLSTKPMMLNATDATYDIVANEVCGSSDNLTV